MESRVLDFIDFDKVNILLEGFNESTGFVTAILDLDGNILSKSGWRQVCTEFHRKNPETSKKCTISDTELANKMSAGEKYHFYKCLNGLIDVAVPIVINGNHIANLFSGQFFFEEPDISFFRNQAARLGFDEDKYIKAIEKVPVVSKVKVMAAMNFLGNMTQLISEITLQKLEQKELNKTLGESEDRFSKIFKASPIAISIERLSDGTLTDINDSWCKLMGYSASETLGRNLAELNILDSDTWNKIREEYLSKGKFIQLEGNILTKTGVKRSILTSAEVITISDDQYSINMVTDITERKLAEEAIQQLNTELENRVIERTSQLEASNRELEAFSYSVSHDLRSPLRHINGFAEILTRDYSDNLPEGAKKHINTITGAAKKMGVLIDDLLSFSKTGRAELKKSTLKMNQVVEDALTQIRPSVKDRNIEWIIAPLPEIPGDYNLLRQVWINLLDNAAKYTRDRENAIIKIGSENDKKTVIFYVRDNGVGFDMKYSDKLFGVFQRLHSSSEFDGTGIGLANVQRIISRHGGRVWAEAEPDKGAVFYFSIPI